MPLSPLAARYDQFILDLDGCVWVGDEPTPGVQEALQELRDAGKRVAFATNDPRAATEDYVTRLWSIGVQASLRDVVTVGGATPAPAGRYAPGTHRVRDRHPRAARSTWPTPGSGC